MIMNEYKPRKVHLYFNQQGARMRSGVPGVEGKPFANTLCKMNSTSPDMETTTDIEKVTCKICMKDRRFRFLVKHHPKATQSDAQPAPAAPLVQQVGRVQRHSMLNGMATRYRRTWRGKLVLQVAEMVPYNYDPKVDVEPGGYMASWRDAVLADLGGGVV